MQLSIISYMRNEADIAEAFVRHHARLAERIIVMLRPSEDETETILASLQREGLPLTVLQDASDVFRQAEALQEAFALAMAEEPQWILPLDADEFLIGNNIVTPAHFAYRDRTQQASFVARSENDACQSEVRESADSSLEDSRTMRAPQDDTTLSHILSSYPTDRITLIPWKTYVPTVKDDPTETNVLRRIRHRRSEEVRPFWKALIPSPLFDHARLQTGNHSVLDLPTNEPLPAVRSSSLSLAHFPVRSVAQIQRKIDTGWTGLAPQASAEQGYHWRDLHARFAKHPPMENDLTDIALRYTLQEDDPLPTLVCEPVG